MFLYVANFFSKQKKSKESEEKQEESPQATTDETGEFGNLNPETQEYETDEADIAVAETSEPMVPEEALEAETGAVLAVSIVDDDKSSDEEVGGDFEQVLIIVEHASLQGNDLDVVLLWPRILLYLLSWQPR